MAGTARSAVSACRQSRPGIGSLRAAQRGPVGGPLRLSAAAGVGGSNSAPRLRRFAAAGRSTCWTCQHSRRQIEARSAPYKTRGPRVHTEAALRTLALSLSAGERRTTPDGASSLAEECVRHQHDDRDEQRDRECLRRVNWRQPCSPSSPHVSSDAFDSGATAARSREPPRRARSATHTCRARRDARPRPQTQRRPRCPVQQRARPRSRQSTR